MNKLIARKKNDENVLTVVYNYIVKAHKTYLKLFHNWINGAKIKAKQNIFVLALPSVKKLLAQSNSSIKDSYDVITIRREWILTT